MVRPNRHCPLWSLADAWHFVMAVVLHPQKIPWHMLFGTDVGRLYKEGCGFTSTHTKLAKHNSKGEALLVVVVFGIGRE